MQKSFIFSPDESQINIQASGSASGGSDARRLDSLACLQLCTSVRHAEQPSRHRLVAAAAAVVVIGQFASNCCDVCVAAWTCGRDHCAMTSQALRGYLFVWFFFMLGWEKNARSDGRRGRSSTQKLPVFSQSVNAPSSSAVTSQSPQPRTEAFAAALVSMLLLPASGEGLVPIPPLGRGLWISAAHSADTCFQPGLCFIFFPPVSLARKRSHDVSGTEAAEWRLFAP